MLFFGVHAYNTHIRMPIHSDGIPGYILFLFRSHSPPLTTAQLPFQIAHSPRLPQDQAANQQRIRRLQRAVSHSHYSGRQAQRLIVLLCFATKCINNRDAGKLVCISKGRPYICWCNELIILTKTGWLKGKQAQSSVAVDDKCATR